MSEPRSVDTKIWQLYVGNRTTRLKFKDMFITNFVTLFLRFRNKSQLINPSDDNSLTTST